MGWSKVTLGEVWGCATRGRNRAHCCRGADGGRFNPRGLRVFGNRALFGSCGGAVVSHHAGGAPPAGKHGLGVGGAAGGELGGEARPALSALVIRPSIPVALAAAAKRGALRTG